MSTATIPTTPLDASISTTTTTTTIPKSTTLRILSSTPFLALVVGYANFVDLFLFAVIIPILPFTLEQRLGLKDEKDIQHTISTLLAVYGAAWFVSSPISALLADYASQFRFGRRVSIIASLAVLSGATALLCFGNSIPVLMAGRALQGASSAFTLTCPQAMLASRAGEDKVGRYMGFVTLANALANVASPVIGGVMFNHVGYQSVYFLSFALIGTQVLLWLIVGEEERVEDAGACKTLPSSSSIDLDLDLDLDLEKAYTWTTYTPRNSVTDKDIKTITWSITETSPDSDSDPDPGTASITTTSSTSSITTITPSPTPAPRNPKPILFHLLSSPRMLTTLLSIFAIYAIIISFDAILPFQSTLLFGFTPTKSGLVMAALYLPSLLGPLTGHVCDRFGTQWLVITGFVIASPLLLALRFVSHGSSPALFISLIVGIGAAAALIITPLSAEIARTVEAMQKERADVFGGRDALAQAYGLQSAMISLACMAGPLWGLLTHAKGWNVMMLSLGVVAIAMVVLNVGSATFGNRR